MVDSATRAVGLLRRYRAVGRGLSLLSRSKSIVSCGAAIVMANLEIVLRPVIASSCRSMRNWKVVASSADRRPMNASGKESPVQYDLEGLSPEDRADVQKQIEHVQKLEQERAALLQAAKVYAGRFAQPAPTKRLYRGDPTAPREWSSRCDRVARSTRFTNRCTRARATI